VSGLDIIVLVVVVGILAALYLWQLIRSVRVLPTQLQLGDRLSDETAEGRPSDDPTPPTPGRAPTS